jgi:hypothetical protein
MKIMGHINRTFAHPPPYVYDVRVAFRCSLVVRGARRYSLTSPGPTFGAHAFTEFQYA